MAPRRLLKIKCTKNRKTIFTLGDVFLAVTPPNTNAVDDISLLGLVTKSASLVGARGARCAVDDVQLAELPAAKQNSRLEDITTRVYQESLTGHGGEIGERPTASFCRAHRCTCMRPYCRLEKRRVNSYVQAPATQRHLTSSRPIHHILHNSLLP